MEQLKVKTAVASVSPAARLDSSSVRLATRPPSSTARLTCLLASAAASALSHDTPRQLSRAGERRLVENLWQRIPTQKRTKS